MQSQAEARVGHQTETWDASLVPDDRGRTNRPSPGCPVEVALDAISGRWTTLVIRELMHGPLSFSELRSRLPSLSAKVLSDRLHGLTARGLTSCVRATGFPARTTYQLTERGFALRPLLITLYAVGSELLGD
ncbi:helix-turn-helix transcriptional regulator [Kibdelosporangium philippinense]|uniref:Helix-turn-helix transcriptional regulator n=1 Tax=Kibdelosporangium philippinense TaxID=211113 RepID=A0ABS8ZFQ4_9PSEU|nr:helix-turn-helix domain-containing protein [Kibdelosporangium philippinense]MCE7005893.1 helix-turn-helix transcriptional regulator [Kibdelosporangium philippinense]